MSQIASATVCLTALVVGLGSVAAVAADQAPAPAADPPYTIGDVTLGTHVLGDEVTPESLAHRVVLLTFWNIESKACTAAMPGLEQVHQTLGPAGLLVVASHVERGAAPEVLDKARKLGLTFPIFDDGSVKGLDSPDPPQSLLFDHTGACIGERRGPPAELARRAAAAVAVAPPAVLAGRRLEKLAALERMLRDEAKYGVVLRKAESLAKSEDGPTAEEASFLVEQLTGHGEALLAKAEGLKGSDAYAAAGLVQRVATAYRGNAVGKKAAEWQREWKRDKQFTDGLQAAGLIAQLETLRRQAVAQPSGGRGRPSPRQPPGGPAVAAVGAGDRIPPPMKAQMAQLAGMVRQLSPGSKYAARAEEIAVELGLQLAPGP
jgi:thiol-disulfide isomerase/thioredoxin